VVLEESSWKQLPLVLGLGNTDQELYPEETYLHHELLREKPIYYGHHAFLKEL
jgi:hypothetical protein